MISNEMYFKWFLDVEELEVYYNITAYEELLKQNKNIASTPNVFHANLELTNIVYKWITSLFLKQKKISV